jgi:hypothetical protein
MPALSTWNLDPTRLLTRRALATLLADQDEKPIASPTSVAT